FSNNLKKYLHRKGISQTELANQLEIPEMTLSNWLNAKTYPRPDKLQLLADYFRIKRSDLTESNAENLIDYSPQTIAIPVLGRIACGDPILVCENYERYHYESPERLPSGKVVYLQAKGKSMEPTIPDGSLVLIREQEDVESGEIAAVLLNGNTEATLKRIKKQDNLIILVPDNPQYNPIIVDNNNPAKIIGKAIRYTFDL
ncbi:MAG: XRE family transcriptional regulator, partial [Sporolactobacillus sp.]